MSSENNFWAPSPVCPSGKTIETCMYRSLSNNPFSARGVALWILDRERNTTSRVGGKRRPREEEGPRESDAPLQEETKQYIHSLVEAMGFPFAKKKKGQRALELNEKDDNLENDAVLVEAESSKRTKLENNDVDSPPQAAASATATAADGTATATSPQSALAKMIQVAKTKQSQKKTAAQKDDSQAENSEEDDEDDFGVVLPSALQKAQSQQQQQQNQQHAAASGTSASSSTPLAEKHPSQMTREEFLSQFKRPPRPGEIGRSAEEIASAESLGYVMSGSRSKAAQLYMNRIQRQLHEREASQLQQQFRKVEDEHMDEELVSGLAQLLNSKKKGGG